jgi:predicted PurR-regulated permease PerM
MSISRVVEYVFFFVLLLGAGFMVWRVISPFVTALALAVIIVTICYPLYEKFLRISYKGSKSIAAGLSTLTVVFVVVIPLILITSVFVKELASFYQTLGTGQELAIEEYMVSFERSVQTYIPDFNLNITEQIKQSAEWLVRNIGAIFAGTLSTIFILLISLVGSFYFFRDGKEFVKIAINISPLPDKEDEVIISRLAKAVRSVATGVVLVSLLQGVFAALGLAIFGIDRAVLWGAVGAILSMIPGVGTLAIMLPAIAYLFFTGSVYAAAGLAAWTIAMVVIVDNIVGPQLMSRGNNLHPFIILISVLGGISAFGPIGFIIGPVIVTLFIVLLEVYNQYIVKENKRKS